MKNIKGFIVNEYVYFVKDKYTFKQQLILNNNLLLVYCFVVVNGDVIHCLLESFIEPTIDEKDKAIKDYLRNKKRLISFEYAHAKEMVKLTSFNDQKY